MLLNVHLTVSVAQALGKWKLTVKLLGKGYRDIYLRVFPGIVTYIFCASTFFQVITF